MKPYIKPDLYYEEFTLATHIASCGFKTQQAEYICSASNDLGIELFNSGTCDWDYNDYEDYCYVPGEGGNGLFGS